MTDQKQTKAVLQLLWAGIASICMFFAGLTSLIFVDKMSLPSNSDWFMYSTAIIILSSLLFIFVLKKIKQDKRVTGLIFLVLFFGLLFTYCQFRGWEDLIRQGHYLSGGPKEDSLLYALTGAHLAHLFAGLIVLVVTMIKSYYNKYSAENHLGIKLAGTYWHFLTILWVYVYFFINYS